MEYKFYETEKWLPVVGYEGKYEVSDMGRVRSLPMYLRVLARDKKTWGKIFRDGKILSPATKRNGYLQVTLCGELGAKKSVMIHTIVLAAFIGPRPGGYHACHGDGIRSNNFLGNLRWDSASGNFGDKLRHGTSNRGMAHSMAKLTDDGVRLIRSASRSCAGSIGRKLGITESHALRVWDREVWGHI